MILGSENTTIMEYNNKVYRRWYMKEDGTEYIGWHVQTCNGKWIFVSLINDKLEQVYQRRMKLDRILKK
jgi:hypothetical protein